MVDSLELLEEAILWPCMRHKWLISGNWTQSCNLKDISHLFQKVSSLYFPLHSSAHEEAPSFGFGLPPAIAEPTCRKFLFLKN